MHRRNLHEWALRHLPSATYMALGKCIFWLRSRRASKNGQPPPHLAFVYGYDPSFEVVGEQFLTLFRDLANLKPDHHVLDVGCGIGRCALPLTRYLSSMGRYEGFDVRPDGIAWCKKHIEKHHPRFRFKHIDLRNTMYHPAGTGQPETLAFPYDSNQFDLVFSKSVFTHLQAPVVRHYLQETARVLKPGGMAFHTYFLLNPTSRAGMERHISQFQFSLPIEDGATVSAKEPEKATAFEEASVRTWHAAASLDIEEPIQYGSWSGRTDGISGQDIILARKSAIGTG